MIIPLITAFTPFGGPIQLYIAAKTQQEVVFKEQEEEQGTQRVMIRGIISATNNNAFVIGEHTIYIDPAKTGSFRQMGTIAVDARAEVKARRVGEILYAEQVVIVGTGQGRSQIVFTSNHQPEKPGDEDHNKGIQYASVNADTEASFRIKVMGSLEQLALYLKNALKLFTSVSI